jgi:tRNA(Leu) C34 or U34 (ribose-2'-O)-methylase TrmL
MAHNHKETSNTEFCGVGLHNPKNGFNVGAAIRACGCFGAAFFAASGTRFKEMKSDFRNMDPEQARKRLPCFLGVNSLIDMIPHDCEIVAIERDYESTNLSTFVHPRRAFYVFGPEDGAVDESILKVVKHKVYVPTNDSMNVGACVNVVLYDRVAKLMSAPKSGIKRCPECGSEQFKTVEKKLEEDQAFLHCNSCGYDGLESAFSNE